MKKHNNTKIKKPNSINESTVIPNLLEIREWITMALGKPQLFVINSPKQ